MQSIEELQIKLKGEVGRWEETLFGWFCDFARQVAVDLLGSLDEELMKERESGLEVIGFREHGVTTVFGDIRIKRRLYRDGQGRYRFLLDEAMGLDKGCHVSPRVKEAVAREQEHRRMRTIPVDGDTLAMLRDYIEWGGLVKRAGKTLLFGINRHRAWQIVKECANRAGLPKLVNPESGKVHNVSPHRLRDAFAVHAIKIDDSGDGLRLLQEHLGHASFNTTAKYRKVAGYELREWYSKLCAKGREERGT